MKTVHAVKTIFIIFILLISSSCGPVKSEIEKSVKKKPVWTSRHENWIEEEDSFLFIGRSEGAKTILSARKNTLSNALSHFSNYFGVTISSEFTEKTAEKDGEFNYEIDLFSKHKGTRVVLQRFNVKDFYYEMTKTGKEKSFSSMMLVEVPKDEMARIEKELKPGQAESDWITKIKNGVKELLKNKEALAGKKIAVGSFSDSTKKISELSLFIAEQVEMVLISDLTDAEVIEVEKLKQDMKSWRLGIKGRVEEENKTQAGNLLGIDAFCFGNYTMLGDTISLNMKIVDSKSGKIISGTSAVLPADKRIVELSKKYITVQATVAKSVSDDIMNDTQNDVELSTAPASAVKPAIKIEIWSEREQYKNGDKIKFFVRTDIDCYLSLIHVDALGKVTMLFPNYYAPSNFVRGSKTYSVPSESAGFDFIASEPYGYEIVRAIASLQPQINIEGAAEPKIDRSMNSDVFPKTEKISQTNPFASFVADASAVTRGINVKAKKAKKGEWAEAVIKIKISR